MLRLPSRSETPLGASSHFPVRRVNGIVLLQLHYGIYPLDKHAFEMPRAVFNTESAVRKVADKAEASLAFADIFAERLRKCLAHRLLPSFCLNERWYAPATYEALL